MTAVKSLQLRCAAANLESDQKGLWLNCHFLIKSCHQIYVYQILEMYTCAGLIIYKSNFILLNILYQNEHLECGQNGATTAIPTALRPLVSYLMKVAFLSETNPLTVRQQRESVIDDDDDTKCRLRPINECS